MATDPMAQDLIRCELCPGKHRKSPVEMVCKTCTTNLCSECVGRHISAQLSIKHNVVGFKFGKYEMPSVSCKIHPKSTCELRCQDCSVPVCAKCLAGVTHKHHDLVEISAIYDSQKDTIKQDTEELQTIIAPTYEKIYEDLENKKSKIPGNYGGLKNSILKQGKAWHDEVDVIIKKNLTMAEQMEKKDLSLISDLQSEIKILLSNIHEMIQKNLNYLKSQEGTEIMDYRSRNEEFRRVPVTFDLSLPSFLPMKIQGEQLSQMFGEIKPSKKTEVPGYTVHTSHVSAPSVKQFLDQPKVNKTIKCTIRAGRVSCVPNTEEFYISECSTIQHLDNNGTVLKEFKTKSGRGAINLTVTRDRKLVYSHFGDRSVNMVNHDKIDAIIRLQGWYPLAVCSTSSDELLVSMADERGQCKVVRYNQSTVKQEIQFDTTGKPLYRWPHHLAENKNFQVCVSDGNTKTVVVTDKAGKLMFRYNGNLSSNKYKKFNPCGIATDNACHILVADYDNKCVHIINHEGGFIRYIDNCDLNYPEDLSVSHDDMLYIVDCKKEVKVIKYLQ